MNKIVNPITTLTLYTLLVSFGCGIITQHYMTLWSFLCSSLITILYASQLRKTHTLLAHFLAFTAGCFLVANDHYQREKFRTTQKSQSMYGVVRSVEQSTSGKEVTIITYLPNITNNTKRATHRSFQIRYILNSPSKLRAGDALQMYLHLPKQAHQPSRFDLRDGVMRTVFTSKLRYTRIGTSHTKLHTFFDQTKKRILYTLRKKLSNKTMDLFAPIFLGVRDTSSRTSELFSYFGLSHYLARSGLHIILLIFFWSILLQLFPIPHRLKQLLLVCITILYAFLSWNTLSFTRALILFVTYTAAIFTKRQYSLLRSLCLLTIGTLAYCPYLLFALDFQLSFGLSFALGFLAHANSARLLAEHGKNKYTASKHHTEKENSLVTLHP